MSHGIVHSSRNSPANRSAIIRRSIRELITDRRILDACAARGYLFRRRLCGPVVTLLH